ncbi:MAG: glycosyltransferase family 2 protein [Opitutaceae bacterium]|nr:glycosyltransferase family 2 protein [Opitutaceae bacterium]
MTEAPSLLSIVVPVYYNEANLPDTIPALLGLREQLAPTELELIFVDDGSGDGSLDLLVEAQRRHPDVVRVVKLSRNFGSMAAIQAGFSFAKGNCVGMISADLQDPIELFGTLIRHWRQGAKAVFAVRQGREESFSQRAFASFFYSMLRRYALPGYPEGGYDFFVIDRQLVDEVVRMEEKNTHLMSLIYWLGFSPVMVPYVRKARRKGKSRWTFAKKVKLLIDSFVAFSYLPVRFLSAFGLLTSLLAVCYAAFQVVARLVWDVPVPGFSTIVVLIALTSGVQMTMLGVLGEYLWRSLDESRRRPLFVVDRIYTSNPSCPISPIHKP